MRIRKSLVSAMFAFSSVAQATTLDVGKGKTYSDLQSAFSKAQAGDVIEIAGNETYKGDGKLSNSGKPGQPIVIRGIEVSGQRPKISGGDYGLTIVADHVTVENLEITQIKGTGVATKGHDITLRNLSVHDNAVHGVLGLDEESGSLTLEYSEIYKNGGGDRHHQIYVATDEAKHPGAIFRMQYCYVHDANGGVSVKSRAERTELFYNWIEGAKFQELDLIGADNQSTTNREDADILGNVLRKTTPGAIARLGDDESGDNSASNGRYRFVNNTMLLSSEGSFAFRAHGGIEAIELHNNVIYRESGPVFGLVREEDAKWVGGSNVFGSNNWISTGVKVPDALKGTLFGSAPSFKDLAGLNLIPTKDSALANSGNDAPQTSSKTPFPTVAITPEYLPSRQWIHSAAERIVRKRLSVIDIGAYESDADASKAPATPSRSLPKLGRKAKAALGLGVFGAAATAIAFARKRRSR